MAITHDKYLTKQVKRWIKDYEHMDDGASRTSPYELLDEADELFHALLESAALEGATSG